MSLENVVTLTVEAVIAIHDEVLAGSVGLPGICPDRSLEGALYRIETHAFYRGVSDLHEIAALYGVAIAQGHVFNDANKRTAFVSMATFLDLNGFDLVAASSEIVDTMVEVAENRLDVSELAQWLRARTLPNT